MNGKEIIRRDESAEQHLDFFGDLDEGNAHTPSERTLLDIPGRLVAARETAGGWNAP